MKWVKGCSRKMKLISAFIFALGIYLASVNGNEPVKPVGQADNGTNLTHVDSGKSSIASGTKSTSDSGNKPLKTPSGNPPAGGDISSLSANGNKSVERTGAPDGEETNRHSPSETSSKPTTSKEPSTPPSFSTTATIPVTLVPPSERLSWNVTEGNQTCILLTGKLELMANNTKVYPIPNQSRAEGSCKKNYITIYFDSSNTTTTLTITFFKNDSAKDYFVQGINGAVSTPFPMNFGNNTLKLFTTPLNKSYSCTPSDDVFISKVPKQNITVSLKVSELKVQAFKTSKGSGFDSGIDCESFPIHTADVVPIIVGCALALLVIAVLAAYLISRRRSQARGYLSM